MSQTEHLQSGKFYHLYNRGINGENLFLKEAHYQRFILLYAKYIDPIAESFAWVMMPNHFHLLVRIKEDVCYKYSKENKSISEADFEEWKWETRQINDQEQIDESKLPVPHRHFSHLFNAYTKYFNATTPHRGNLFERAFKRKEIDNEAYLKNVLLYIHHNPVHHGFCSHPSEYPWSSYLTCVSAKPTKLQREAVMGWFDNEANFHFLHNGKVDVERMDGWLEM